MAAAIKCSACHQLITERYLCQVAGLYYHETCLKCYGCSRQLQSKSLFHKNDKFYCKQHYYRKFSPFVCKGCDLGIAPDDVVYKLNPDNVYHVTCLTCHYCHVHKAKGDKIGLTPEGAIACFEHLPVVSKTANVPSSSSRSKKSGGGSGRTNGEGTSMPPTHVPLTSDIKNSPNLPAHLASTSALLQIRKLNRRRGPRTSIKATQLELLNRAFEATPKPSKHARAKLAMETSLSSRVIQVWFQNRRSKERRLKHLCNRLRENELRRQQALENGVFINGGFETEEDDSVTAASTSSILASISREDDDWLDLDDEILLGGGGCSSSSGLLISDDNTSGNDGGSGYVSSDGSIPGHSGLYMQQQQQKEGETVEGDYSHQYVPDVEEFKREVFESDAPGELGGGCFGNG